MKKLISLSAAVMIGVVVFAQDTIPGKNNLPDSRRDTVPGNSTWNKTDTSIAKGKNQWPADSINKKGWPNKDSTLQNNSGRTDTSLNINAKSRNPDSSNIASQKATFGNTQDTSANVTTNMSANSKSNGGNSSAASTTETLSDRVMMKDDQMYIVKNNESAILDKDYKLESGAVITKEGNVNYPGGKTVKLKNGQFIEITPATSSSNSATEKTTRKKATTKSSGTTKKKTPVNP